MPRKRPRGGIGLHKVELALEIPRTLDLQERANQTHAVQGLIGQFVAELLANGVPLTLAVSDRRVWTPTPDTDKLLVTIHWHEAKLDVPHFNEMIFVKRCLNCANHAVEGHECPKFDQPPSLEENLEEEPSSETSPSPLPQDGETEPVSTD